MGKLGDAEVVGGSYISERTGSGWVQWEDSQKKNREETSCALFVPLSNACSTHRQVLMGPLMASAGRKQG